MAGEKRRAIGKWAAWALVFVVVVYPLSYAPFVRLQIEHRTADGSFLFGGPFDASMFPFYQPVDWLIDNTPLKKPLIAWAHVWGVGDEFQSSADSRAFDDRALIQSLYPSFK